MSKEIYDEKLHRLLIGKGFVIRNNGQRRWISFSSIFKYFIDGDNRLIL